MSGILLRQEVLEALEFEPSIDAANIGVSVDEGIVTLTGHVPTYAQRAKAEQITSRVKGVRGIAEEIEVRPAGTHITADDEIARRVANILRWHTAVPSEKIRIVVEKDHVTLSGEVEWDYQRDAAERAIRGIAGIRGITGHLSVTPRASSSDVREHIEKALKRDAQLEAAGSGSRSTTAR